MRATIAIADLDHTWWRSFRQHRQGDTSMSTQDSPVTAVRVDCEHGITWVPAHYDLKLRVIQQTRGSDENVHRLAAWWAHV